MQDEEWVNRLIREAQRGVREGQIARRLADAGEQYTPYERHSKHNPGEVARHEQRIRAAYLEVWPTGKKMHCDKGPERKQQRAAAASRGCIQHPRMPRHGKPRQKDQKPVHETCPIRDEVAKPGKSGRRNSSGTASTAMNPYSPDGPRSAAASSRRAKLPRRSIRSKQAIPIKQKRYR